MKQVTLKGFLKNISEKKITFLFLDDDIDPFTSKFLRNYYTDQLTPVKHNEFTVKILNKSRAYMDKNKLHPTTFDYFINKMVCINVQLRHYYFNKKNGWSMDLIDMVEI